MESFNIRRKLILKSGSSHPEPSQRWMTLLELMLESMMIIDIPDWGLCP